MMKKLLISASIIILVIIAVLIINLQMQPISQPLIPPEDEEETELEEPEPEEEEEIEETEEEEREDETLGDRLHSVFQNLFNPDFNIVAFGDSLTRGVGDATDGGGYVGILERTINQEGEIATFHNFGVPGNRTDHLLDRLELEDVQEAIADADIVLITVGANDIMKVLRENITNLNLEDFVEERQVYEERLGEVLETLQEMNNQADIYLLGLFNPFARYFEDIEEINMIVDSWNDTGIQLTLEDDQLTFVPLVDLFTGNEDDIFADDNFHPNYQGYYLMAGRVLEYISNEEG